MSEVDSPEGSYTALAAGDPLSCAIRSGDGALECWSYDEDDSARVGGLYAVPGGSYADVAIGDGFGCAVRSGDGGLDCWFLDGVDALVEFEGPRGSFKAITGVYSLCAIRGGDGGLECWDFGGVDALAGTRHALPEGSFAEMAGDSVLGCAIRSGDRTLACWGYDFDDGNAVQRDVPEGSYVAIAARGLHDWCAIRSGDGGVDCWRYDRDEELEVLAMSSESPVPRTDEDEPPLDESPLEA